MIRFFAQHPTAANLLMILMLAAGIFQIGGLQRETLPDASPVEVEIRAVFPGATAKEVEDTVLLRLEDALDGVRYIKEMTSVATQSLGTVVLEMDERGDYNEFRNEIDNAISGIDDFPDDVEPPVIVQLNTRQPVLDVLVSGPLSPVALKAWCEQVKNRLVADPRISEIEIEGFSDHLLRIEISREAMLRFGLNPVDIANRIGRQSLDLPAGRIESSETVLVRVEESRRTRQALEDLILIGNAGGAEIRLGDIADVRDEFELEEDRIQVGENRGAILKVLKSKTEDTLTVAAAVQEILADVRREFPELEITVINDQSALVQDRISLLVENGWLGCILVFVTMWFFFNARLSFWVVMSLPIAFLAGFALVPQFGLTINMLTMVGLLMALGLLMDDGIVIAENIARRRKEGEPAMQAAIRGVQEVAGGVFSSFLTTCSVLGPLMFLTGELGKILRVLPMMLLLVLAASLVEAFLILPSHLGHSLAHHPDRPPGPLRRLSESIIEAARSGTGVVTRWLIEWRYLTAGLTLMIFLGTLSLLAGNVVRFQVFPELDGDTIVGRVLLPPGTPLAETEEVVEKMIAALERTNDHFKPSQPGEIDLVQTTYIRFNQNTDALETGAHVATVTADLLTNEQRVGTINEVIDFWSRELGYLPEVLSVTFDEPVIGPAGRAIDIELTGLELPTLDSVSTEIQEYLRQFVGVSNITDNLRQGEKEWRITLRPGAVGLGINAQDLARQLRGSFQGLLSDQVQLGEEAYDVEVRFAEADRSNVADLEDYLVTLPSGERVPLVEIAELNPGRGWSRITRQDGVQAVTVFASVDSRKSNTRGLLNQFSIELLPELKNRFPQLNVRFRGQAERGQETGQSMLWAALVGCLGVFVILSYQFRSYIEPLIVMAAIPFALVGVVWGHLAFQQSISLPSVMGYASLAGIVVNDSILLVLFLKSARKEGIPVAAAAEQASQMRFRAVLITSLTTIAGLLPLLLERSLQAQVLIPIAISICFGLLTSTLMVLFVIPPFYVLLSDFGWTEPLEERDDDHGTGLSPPKEIGASHSH